MIAWIIYRHKCYQTGNISVEFQSFVHITSMCICGLHRRMMHMIYRGSTIMSLAIINSIPLCTYIYTTSS